MSIYDRDYYREKHRYRTVPSTVRGDDFQVKSDSPAGSAIAALIVLAAAIGAYVFMF
jgi:hypothetical protein